MRLITVSELTYMDKAHGKQALNAIRRSLCRLVPSMTNDSHPVALSQTPSAECPPLNHPLLPTPSTCTYQSINQSILHQNTASKNILLPVGQQSKPPSLITSHNHHHGTKRSAVASHHCDLSPKRSVVCQLKSISHRFSCVSADLMDPRGERSTTGTLPVR